MISCLLCTQYDNLTFEILLRLPTVIVKSSHVRNNSSDFEQKFPINIPDAVWNNDKDGFPWICSIFDLACYTIQSNSKFEMLIPLKSTISVALTQKRRDENEFIYDHSFAIHIDTEPMQFHFYEEQVSKISFKKKHWNGIFGSQSCSFQITFVMTSIEAITKALSTNFCIDERVESAALEICERANNTNYHSDLKELFGTLKTKSENSSDDTLQIDEGKLIFVTIIGMECD